MNEDFSSGSYNDDGSYNPEYTGGTKKKGFPWGKMIALMLVAALLGGQLFGLVGIIFFIPLTAVIYQLIGQGTDRRLAAKGRSTADGGKREPEAPSQEAEKG